MSSASGRKTAFSEILQIKTSTSLNSSVVGKPEIIPLSVDDLVLRRSASNGANIRMRHTRDLRHEQWQTLDPLIPRPGNDVMAEGDLGRAAGPS